MTTLEMSALRAAAELSLGGARGEAGFGDLAADCAARLRARLARPQRAPGDWSVELPASTCACELCGTLRAFLGGKIRRTVEWPLAKDRRQHVRSRIDAAELPVTRVTGRHGRPLTLVLNKTDTLFTREQEARTRDETDLEWLAAQWKYRRLTGSRVQVRQLTISSGFSTVTTMQSVAAWRCRCGGHARAGRRRRRQAESFRAGAPRAARRIRGRTHLRCRWRSPGRSARIAHSRPPASWRATAVCQSRAPAAVLPGSATCALGGLLIADRS